MEIIDTDLNHLSDYFKNSPGKLKPGSRIKKGMYYYEKSDILYDPRLKYFLPEVQFFIITHAILHRKEGEGGNNRLIDIYEKIDAAAIQRSVAQFPTRTKSYFVDILSQFLLKHPGEIDIMRITNLKRFALYRRSSQ